LASVALLTVLVVADATVASAQSDSASSAQSYWLESRELLLERSLAGSATMTVLAQVQAYLSSNVAGCGSLPTYFGTAAASGNASGIDSGISYSVNATSVAVSTGSAGQADNLTIVRPFAGSVPGFLNLNEDLSVREVGGGGSVDLFRRESHLLNVPIQAGSASYLCSSTLGSLAAALSRAPCNATLEQAGFSALLPSLLAEAAAYGFALTAGWSAYGCATAYWVTLVEPGVAGPTGSFDWTVHGSGTTA